MKVYKSYEEINTDLKILKLKQEIHIEEVKLNLKLTKKYGSPGALIKTAADSVKMKVKEKTYVVKRVAEQYFDQFNNSPDPNLEIKVERIENISDPDSAIAGTKTIIRSSNTQNSQGI